jgi:very-short-patch-repair endonuclease
VYKVVQLANPQAESPMETRLRLALVLAGLPEPTVQFPVVDQRGRVVARLDLAYPSERLGVEYDGVDHRTQHRAMRDLDRQAKLTDLRWRVLRFTAADVLVRPTFVAERVRHALCPR